MNCSLSLDAPKRDSYFSHIRAVFNCHGILLRDEGRRRDIKQILSGSLNS